MMRRVGQHTLILLASICILLGVVIRVLVLLRQPELWVDELHTGWTVSAGLDQVGTRSVAGNQSPLYFWGIWFWTQPFPASSLWLRMPSLIAGLAAMGSAGWIAGRLTQCSVIGWFVAAAIALDSHSIYFATEARPFAWVQLVALIQTFLFWQKLQDPSRKSVRLAWVVCSVGLFYLHLTTLIFIFAQLLVGLVSHMRAARFRDIRKGGILDGLAVAIGCLPGGWLLFSVVRQKDQWASFGTFPEFYFQLQPVWITGVLFPLLLISMAWMLQNFGGERNNLLDSTKLPVLLVFSGTAMLSLLIVAIGSIPWSPEGTPLLALGNVRYVISSVTLVFLSSGLSIRLFHDRDVRQFLAALLLVAIGASSFTIREFARSGILPKQRNESWGQLEDELEEIAPGTPLLLCSNLVEDGRLSHSSKTTGFEEYCQFPVTNRWCDIGTQRKVIPLATWSTHRLGIEPLSDLFFCNRLVFVARVNQADFHALCDEITGELASQNVRFVVSKTYHRFGDLHLAVLIRY